MLLYPCLVIPLSDHNNILSELLPAFTCARAIGNLVSIYLRVSTLLIPVLPCSVSSATAFLLASRIIEL